MPRYFFHVMDGRAIVDAEGVELAGIAQARTEALKTAGEILADEGTTFWAGKQWNMTVVGEDGKTVFALRFQADDY